MSTNPSPQDSDRTKSNASDENPQSHPVLHESLDEYDLEALYDLFSKQTGKRFDAPTLKQVLENVVKITFPPDEFNVMFMRMNTARDGYVTWNEFISYLILCYEQQEVKAEFETLENPIPKATSLIKSNHRYAINRIIYCPTVRPDRTISWHDGSLMTCSRDGTINYWSLDVQFERSVKSTCPNLRVQQTWVTDMVALPDVSVVCTSSTERDLRFYDTSARKFELRVIFTSMDYAIYTMDYCFSDDPNEESKLVLGDMGGNIHVIFIDSVARGPFRSQLGLPLLEVRYDKVKQGLVDGFRVKILPKQHTNVVLQIQYYQRLNTIISCSECPNIGLLMRDISEDKGKYIYALPKGAWCFSINGTQWLASGGPDCLVRLWNPFVPQNPTAVFYGHHTAISSVLLQDDAKFLYSLSQDKCIRVWDCAKQTCVQNYLGIPQELGEHSDMTTLYNPESRQWILGSTMLAVVPLSPKQSGEHTDGVTHTSGVSVVLYNPLFKVVVTCGLDSHIIVWNPWDGRRMLAIKEAHTKTIHAEIIPIEITSACFDPGFQRLITGAHDGTLKIWNFNTGTCLRNMKIEQNCEIKRIIWVKNRILVMGWNRRVTEFGDGGDVVSSGGEFFKNWDKRHSEDISSAAVRIPQTIVTGTYDGELIMWRLETGQPYKQYNCADPTSRIKIQYKKQKLKPEAKINKFSKKNIIARALGKPITEEKKVTATKSITEDDFPKPAGRRLSAVQRLTAASSGLQPQKSGSRTRRLSTVVMPEQVVPLRKLAIHSMMFLSSRTMDPEIGTLLIALENGTIQVWSHHINGGFITSFSAIHKAGDYVICMASDVNNEYLFTGSSVGYIKIWLVKNYCIQCDEHISMPKLRLTFPFLWGDLFMCRAARIASGQPKPLLLSSYKAHAVTISDLVYIDDAKILISASTDYSARMWTLGGRYLQTLGTFKPWKHVSPNPDDRDNFDYTVPPDLERIGSSTTLRVVSGGATARKLTFKQLQAQQIKEYTPVDATKIYGIKLKEPILGNYYKPSVRTTQFYDIKFDTSFPYIPVYQHLNMPPYTNIRPTTMKPNIFDSTEEEAIPKIEKPPK